MGREGGREGGRQRQGGGRSVGRGARRPRSHLGVKRHSLLPPPPSPPPLFFFQIHSYSAAPPCPQGASPTDIRRNRWPKQPRKHCEARLGQPPCAGTGGAGGRTRTRRSGATLAGRLGRAACRAGASPWHRRPLTANRLRGTPDEGQDRRKTRTGGRGRGRRGEGHLTQATEATQLKIKLVCSAGAFTRCLPLVRRTLPDNQRGRACVAASGFLETPRVAHFSALLADDQIEREGEESGRPERETLLRHLLFQSRSASTSASQS